MLSSSSSPKSSASKKEQIPSTTVNNVNVDAQVGTSQKMIVFRLGKMIGAKGPGTVLVFPWLDRYQVGQFVLVALNAFLTRPWMLAMLPFLFHHNNSSLTMEALLRLAQRYLLELHIGDGDSSGDGDGDEHLSNSTLLVAESLYEEIK